jgi:hypothetical protein
VTAADFLRAYASFFRDLDMNPLELRPAVDEACPLLDSLDAPRRALFQPIGLRKDGSVLASWEHRPGSSLDERPVVWLDSECEPFVVAATFQRFTSVLAYGTGFLYDLARATERHAEDPTRHPDPARRFADSYATQIEERLPLEVDDPDLPDDDGYREALRFLEAQRIETTRDPVGVAREAYALQRELLALLRGSIVYT